MLPVNMVDTTGIYAIREVFDRLRARGVVVGLAARDSEWTDWARERGFADAMDKYRVFNSLEQAVAAYEKA